MPHVVIINIPRGRVWKEFQDEGQNSPPEWFMRHREEMSRLRLETLEEEELDHIPPVTETVVICSIPVQLRTKKKDLAAQDLRCLGCGKIIVQILRLSRINNLVELCEMTESELRNKIRPYSMKHYGKIPSDSSYIKVVTIVTHLKRLGMSLREDPIS